jgi:hypothetical protein
MNTLQENNDLPANEMALRDYFAAKAMQVYLDKHFLNKNLDDDDIAFVSYVMADAMIAARER